MTQQDLSEFKGSDSDVEATEDGQDKSVKYVGFSAFYLNFL